MTVFTSFKLPLVNTPQTFGVNISGVDYILTCKWNDSPDAGWVLDIADSSANPIVCNVPLITGTDCLNGLEYLGIGGSFYVVTNGSSPTDVPTFENLGVESNLYLQTSSP